VIRACKSGTALALDRFLTGSGIEHVFPTQRYFIRSKTMTISEFKKGTLAALMVFMLALGTLTACASSTDEGGSDSGGGCEGLSGEELADCKEGEVQNLPF